MEEKNKKAEIAYKEKQEFIERQAKKDSGFILDATTLKRWRDNKIYLDLGYDTFSEMMAEPEMRMAPSTAYSYIRILDVAVENEIDLSIFDELSYERFRTLIPYINKENKDELLHSAKTLTKNELKHLLSGGEKNEGFDDVKPIPKVFRCNHVGSDGKICGKFRWDAMPEEICGGHN